MADAPSHVRRASSRPANQDQGRELERMVADFFRCVSFPEGGRPAYAQLHELFIAGGTLIKTSGEALEINTVSQFIASRQAMVDAGRLTAFLEVEIAEITEWFGNIAHRLSTYTKRGTLDGQVFEGAGVISTQFLRTAAGWKISAMAWDDERAGLTIPAHYAGTGA